MEPAKIFLLSLFFISVTSQITDPYRLPTNVLPSNYEIALVLGSDFYETNSFTGTVSITVDVQEAATTIRLNSANITYPDGSITATNLETGVQTALTVTYAEEYEQLTLTSTTTTLAAGSYILKFENYQAVLHEDMSGFYLSYYENENDETEYVATTQFQTTYARRAFPCFDEPSFKATFNLSITRPEGYISLGPTTMTTTGNTDTFSETPTMSTYLLAFIVSKFKAYGGQDSATRLQYDVWCREEALPTAKYAYEVGQKLLDKLNEYTQLSYYDMENVEKMDQVAIPDFSAGAMENWGLVTYRETALLWDENESTNTYMQRVATVIAHEFAHMWFGNLVTLSWWSYTWLNEGFARYYQYHITAQVETTWELEKQFVIEQQQVIFAADAVASSAALNSAASTPAEISSKFASTSYNKGASVIRMMINFLGEDNYLQGIRQYLIDNQYSNTVPIDLFTSLAAFAPDLPADLATIMGTWTDQSGYPVVTVSRNDSGLVLKQERFLLNSAPSQSQWYVPITYTTAETSNFVDTTVVEWLLPEEELLIEIDGSAGWVLVNILETGYYRVNYNEELWEALAAALNSSSVSTFPDLNRAQIVDDVLNLARANKLGYSTALDVTSFLANEESYYPWYAAFNAFSFLRRRIDRSTYVGETLELHIVSLMTKLYDSVSFDITGETSHVNILKTALTLQWACELGIEECVNEANDLFTKLVDDETSINPNLRSTVYCSAIREAETRDNWDYLWNKFGSTKLATEQITILTALGCSRTVAVLNDYLQLSINSSSGIRKQDANSVFSAVLAGNPTNVEVAFEFLKENVEAIVDYYEGMNALTSIVNGIADRLTTKEQIDEFEAFIENNSDILKDAAVTGQAAVETARANLAWVEANQEELNDWLYEVYGSATSVTISFTVFLVAIATSFLNN